PPAQSQGRVQTWVNSRWKLLAFPGHFSAAINKIRQKCVSCLNKFCHLEGLKEMKKIIVSISIFFLLFMSASNADAGAVFTVRTVMTGNSSIGNDQVWIRADITATGIAPECYYAGLAYFYVNNNGTIDKNKAMSLATTAQVAKIPVSVEYWIAASTSDFWGFGTTKCVIDRIGLGQ
ncbi:hypothetical protein, partial [Sphingomonas sp. YR710]|uniref:hypothetical protein n=1 Tax=Sphingomonas sp. YR710 TaxID=1882773 RepID=UPI001C40AC47